MQRAVAIAGLMVLIGCGSSDGGTGGGELLDRALVPAMTEAMTGQAALPLSEQEGVCAADRVVDDIGDARLRELGATDGDAGDLGTYDYTDDEIGVFADAIVECRPDAHIAILTTGGTFSADDASCILGEMSDAAKRMTLATGFLFRQPPDDVARELFAAMGECDVDLTAS